MLRRRLIQGIENLLGSPKSAAVTASIAKIGLRGLGVNVEHGIEQGGEGWFLDVLIAKFPACACFDVGANIGHYAEALVARGAGRILACEPAGATFQQLASRLSGNKNVTCLNIAVGEKTGEVTFYEASNKLDSDLASRDASLAPIAADKFIARSVTLDTLDSICAKHQFAPNFIKIDVEGFELEVLKGANKLFLSSPPAAIQFEFNEYHLKRRQLISDFMELLPRYKFYRLAARALRALGDGQHYLSNIYAYSNIVCLRNDVCNQFSRYI